MKIENPRDSDILKGFISLIHYNINSLKESLRVYDDPTFKVSLNERADRKKHIPRIIEKMEDDANYARSILDAE